MTAFQPDIVVVTPDGEYLMVIEVKPNDYGSDSHQKAIRQIKNIMVSVGCSSGLLVLGERVILLHDSFEQSDGSSISIVGEAHLPDFLLPDADEQWKGKPGVEFESRIQRWLEKLKLTSSLDSLPNDLRKLIGESIISILKLGEIRAAHPRWSQVV